MKNRRTIALLLAAVLAVSLLTVSADLTAEKQPEEEIRVSQDIPRDKQTPPAEEVPSGAPEQGETPNGEEAEVPAKPSPDPEGTVTFANLEQRMRDNNLDILAIQEGITMLETLDYDELYEELRDQLNKIADAQHMMLSLSALPSGHPYQMDLDSYAYSQTKTVYEALEQQYKDIKNGELQKDNADLIRQQKNLQNQIIMGGQSLYLGLAALDVQSGALDRQNAALDRTLEELDLRYGFGQISALQLKQAQAGKTALESGMATLKATGDGLNRQLEMMLGEEMTGQLRLTSLPAVTGEQLAAMDLEKDLETFKANSYTLYTEKQKLDQGEEDFKEAARDHHYKEEEMGYRQAKHTWQATQYAYESVCRNYELKFTTLYEQVLDFDQVLWAAKTALAVEESEYAVAQLKYEQGTISKNAMLTARDERDTAEEKVTSASLDLFSAYNNYRWAVDHGILN